MLKRKLISLSRHHARNKEKTDSSDSYGTVRKRFRQQDMDDSEPHARDKEETDSSDSDGNVSKRFRQQDTDDSEQHTRDKEETDSSDSEETSREPFMRYDTGDSEQPNSDNDPESLLSSSDEEDEELNCHTSIRLQSTLNISSNEEFVFNKNLDASTSFMNNSQYNGYSSFIESFQFFSDEESGDSDSELTFSCVRNESFLNNMLTASISDPKPTIEDIIQDSRLSNGARVIGYYPENLEVVFMDYSSSLPIVGNLTVTLLAGKASIQGYYLKINQPVSVFSNKQTGFLSVTSHYCDEELVYKVKENVATKLKSHLKGVPANIIHGYVKKYLNYSSAVFVLQNKGLPPELEFLQLYNSFATYFEKYQTETKYIANLKNKKHLLEFGKEYEEIFATVHKHLLKINHRKPGQAENTLSNDQSISSDEDLKINSTSKNSPAFQASGFRILVYGPTQSGKSTMLRYLVNCLLSKYPEVYYLDTDPGQTEFTPSGTLSLVQVTKPLLGPPFTHLSKPLKSIFIGSITPETSLSMHMQSVSHLIQYFNLHHRYSLLVVNTVGWVTGAGDIIYKHIRKVLAAPVEIHLEPKLVPLKISVKGRILNCTVGFHRNVNTSTDKGEFRPKVKRELTLLAYFGQCQAHFRLPQTLNAFRPQCICWDDIAVYNFNKRLTYTRYYEALNNSVVALCHVEEDIILTPTNPDYPVTLSDEPINECLGYGFVRAVDEEHHLLYIVTPLSQNILNSSVNAILSGNILIPRSVIFDQNIYGVELDFTDKSEELELQKGLKKIRTHLK